MEYNNIKLEINDGIAIITFNRPETMNAMTEELMEETRDALSCINRDLTVRVAIVTGEGKAFMAGANLKVIGDMPLEENTAYNNKIIAMINDFNRCRVPVIAAINGFAFGGGLELSLACAIRIASKKAKMGLPEVGLGILPGAGGTQRLPRLIPQGRALKLLLTGDTLTADDAFQIGIVDEVAEPDELMSVCVSLAQRIASKPPLSVEIIKDCVINGAEMDLDHAIKYTSSQLEKLVVSDDFQEGIKSFLEKREGHFNRK